MAVRVVDYFSLVLKLIQVFSHQIGGLVDPFTAGADGGRALVLLTRATNIDEVALVLHFRR